jgi:hypothetical protein
MASSYSASGAVDSHAAERQLGGRDINPRWARIDFDDLGHPATTRPTNGDTFDHRQRCVWLIAHHQPDRLRRQPREILLRIEALLLLRLGVPVPSVLVDLLEPDK